MGTGSEEGASFSKCIALARRNPDSWKRTVDVKQFLLVQVGTIL
jgi:hypothetical protein